jgi:CRISPR/Cas system endoribonuclease Cas6 (RAMP superfamily)
VRRLFKKMKKPMYLNRFNRCCFRTKAKNRNTGKKPEDKSVYISTKSNEKRNTVLNLLLLRLCVAISQRNYMCNCALRLGKVRLKSQH